MINLFFEESHDKIKNACALSFCEILDYCFDNKVCKGGHKAAPLLTDPLFEILRSAINHQQRQFAANILRKMCLHYQGDSQVVDANLVKDIVTTGISKKIYDSDFLMTISELIQQYGITEVLGVNSAQAIPYFVNSLNSNITGNNAIGKVQRDQNVLASLWVLETVARDLQTEANINYVKVIGENFNTLVQDTINKMRNESNHIYQAGTKTTNEWKKLMVRIASLAKSPTDQVVN